MFTSNQCFGSAFDRYCLMKIRIQVPWGSKVKQDNFFRVEQHNKYFSFFNLLDPDPAESWYESLVRTANSRFPNQTQNICI